jgi:Ankyrin repeats (many copies)
MKKHSLLDSIKVKTPCTESWDEMQGNSEVRFCSHCTKHVHNLSSMTHRDAIKIVAESKGNICVRYVKRPDGKIATIDRPLHHIGRRAKIAAGAIAATLSLSALAYSQGAPLNKVVPTMTETEKTPKEHETKNDPIEIKFKIIDAENAVVVNASVTLKQLGTDLILTGISDDEGIATIMVKEAGNYEVNIYRPGFQTLIISDLRIDKSIIRNITLEAGEFLTGIISICLPRGYFIKDTISENNYEGVWDAIKEGAELNPKDAELPPLHQAVVLGYIRIVKLLLDNGANPNLRTDEGKTPLDFADSDEMRELLKEYSAKEF